MEAPVRFRYPRRRRRVEEKVKNISELLNQLLSKPAEAPGLLTGKNPVASKGPQSGNGSFEEVLNRLASQTENPQNGGSVQPVQTASQNQGGVPASSGPNNSAETITTVSETTVSIVESIKASNPGQLIQAEQTLASLAVGLAHLLQLMFQLNQGDLQQAQTTLKTLGLGPEAVSGLQNLLNGLQTVLQKMPPEQNPLALPPSQQTALLGQLFQQMIQSQQVLFGVAPAAQNGSPSNNQTSGGANAQAAVLQISFSEAQATQLQEGNAQASQVFIDLQTFKMSAIFIQEGRPAQPAVAPQNPQELLNALSQALGKLNPASNLPVMPAGSLLNTASQNELNQNFRNLVQLLMQSGVSQAALTTLMSRQQEAGGLNASTNQAAVVLPPSVNQGQSANAEIPAVNPVEVAVGTANNANAAQTQRSIRNPTPSNQGKSANLETPNDTNATQAQGQVVNAGSQTNQGQPPNSSTNSAALVGMGSQKETPTTTNSPLAGAVASNLEEGNFNSANSALTQVAPVGTTEVLPPHEAAVLNNTVDRLNAIAAQILTTKQSAVAENLPGQNRGVTGTVVGNTVVAQREPGAMPVQPTAVAPTRQALPGQNNFDPREAAILNDTVVRMNASSLHTIQGSIGGNNTTPEINLTGGQVLSAKFATDLTNPLPPTFGNPSVPITAPAPARQTPVLNTAVEAAASATPESQTIQNTAVPTILPNAVQPGLGANVASSVQQPVNQTVPLVFQTVGATPAVNQTATLNNGAVSAAGNNNTNLITAAVFGATTNPAVTSNPGPTSTPVPNVVVPLPQPVTLPVGTNPSAAQTTTQGPLPATGPLNQAILPPPTSQAPIVPATAVVGEGVKGEIPATTVPRNENFANPSAVANAQPLSSMMPVSPEAVAPSGTVLETATGLGTLNVTDKNAPNSQAVLEGNALLALSAASNQPASVTHNTAPVSISSTSGANFDTTSLLNQISQQMANQAGTHSVSRLNFQLIPESLGRVTVQIALVDQSVSARILVTNPQVRETLQTHMVDLKSALNQAGLQIDQLQVQVQGGGGNLLAQYYQYQQEGFGYRQPVPLAPTGTEGAQNPENSGDLGGTPVRISLVDVLA